MLTAPQWRRDVSVSHSCAPTARRSPVEARQSRPGTRRRCWRGLPPDSDYWSTAVAGKPVPGQARGLHGGYSRLRPSCGQRRSCCGRLPRPCGRGAVPVPPGIPSHKAEYSACGGALPFLPLPAPFVMGRLLYLVQRLFRFRGNRGGRRVVQHTVNHVVILFSGELRRLQRVILFLHEIPPIFPHGRGHFSLRAVPDDPLPASSPCGAGRQSNVFLCAPPVIPA